MNTLTDGVIRLVSKWLLKEAPPQRTYLSDFNLICQEIQPGDVLLIEGRSRASKIIKQVTQSTWSHAALYIGQLNDIENPKLQSVIKQHFESEPTGQLLIESEIGLGTIISPMTKYKADHIRIVRARGLNHEDVQKIIHFAISRLGRKYDVRHLFDLARFIFPWGLYPRKWRSILFQHNALQPTEDICSSMIAYAFQTVRYPILPLVREDQKKQLEFVRRNPRLFTPSDFDYSPYFDVIKYPIFPPGTKGAYHPLPWREDIISNDRGSIVSFQKQQIENTASKIEQFFTSTAYAVVGASANRAKYGNKVLRCYIQNNKKVYPVNPHEKVIEGVECASHLADLPADVKSISIITPAKVTEQIVEQAILKGITNIWMQTGAESPLAIKKCKQHQINVIAGGPCILIEMEFQE